MPGVKLIQYLAAVTRAGMQNNEAPMQMWGNQGRTCLLFSSSLLAEGTELRAGNSKPQLWCLPPKALPQVVVAVFQMWTENVIFHTFPCEYISCCTFRYFISVFFSYLGAWEYRDMLIFFLMLVVCTTKVTVLKYAISSFITNLRVEQIIAFNFQNGSRAFTEPKQHLIHCGDFLCIFFWYC